MSVESKTLEIFEPVKDYLSTLCSAESNICETFKSDPCQKLINSTTLQSDGKIKENNLNAFANFAVRLKEYDAPKGFMTAKNQLKEIFTTTEVNDNYVENVVNKIETQIPGINMNDRKCDNDKETYKASLKNIYNKDRTGEEMFELWENDCWDTYKHNQEKFKGVMNNIKHENLDGCQKNILNKFFNIKADGKTMTIDEYKKASESDSKTLNVRLNMQVEDGKAKITYLLPEKIRNAFNEYLKKLTRDSSDKIAYPKFVYSGGTYKLEVSTKPEAKPDDKAKFTVSEYNAEEVLKWVKEQQESLSKGTKLPLSEIDYTADKVPDTEPYYDEDFQAYKWDEDFQIQNFQDMWRMDRNGNLYKKDSKGKYSKYEHTEKDSEEFSKKCMVYNDPTKCAKFFQDMVSGKNVDNLSRVINDNNFVRSYSDLKKNIVNVNPVFVIGTLKMFGFQKYTKIDAEGNKCVKIEDFSNWWDRQSKKDINKTEYTKDPMGTISGTYPGVHNDVEPPAPANMELFFKLLIAFINNNEFILNPRDKSVVLKSGKPKVMLYGPPQDYVYINGNKVSRPIDTGIKKNSEPESLSDLAAYMDKNPLYGSKSLQSNFSYDNTLDLKTLLGLMVGVTTGGKISLSRAPGFVTGMGYLTGGDPEMRECTNNAEKTFVKLVNQLENKYNKKLNDEYKAEIHYKIMELAKLEDEVIRKLQTLVKYRDVVSTLDDKKSVNVGESEIKRANTELQQASKKAAEKSDTVLSLMRSVLEEKSSLGPSSFLSPL